MSAVQLQAVLDADIRPCATKCVAMVLAWHCNSESGHAWPSMATLARECSMSERHVKRAVAALKRSGVLVVVKPSNGGAHRATTIYAFDSARLVAGLDGVRGCTGDTGAPRAPASPEGVRPRPLPRAPASPKRDERKKTSSSSLSSKAHTASAASGAASGRASPPSLCVAGGTSSATAKAANSQQPLTSGNSQGEVPSYLTFALTPAGILRKGRELGLGEFNPGIGIDYTDEWRAYQRDVIKAATVAHEKSTSNSRKAR